MAIESGGNHQGDKLQNDDVEMADISLLNNPEEDSSTREREAQPHSWYSASGRGFSLNGRQTETQEAPSHIGTVLGEAYYSRERWNPVWTHLPSLALHYDLPQMQCHPYRESHAESYST